MQKKTIYDVAKEAGVSISTVSRVINGSPKVKESTRLRVEAACKDYHPTASARELQSKKTRTIGVLINHEPEYFFLNEVYINALMGMSVVAKEKDYHLLLDISSDEQRTTSLFREQKVDGFILMGIKQGCLLPNILTGNKVPFVLLGSYATDNGEDICQMDINDEKAVYRVTNYLLGLNHKRIGFISGSLDYTSCSNRLAGYQKAMADAGIEVKEEWIQACEDLTETKAEHLAKELLFQKPRVTAIVAFNDSVAMAVYKAAQECGLEIPRQLSVVGFDDTRVAPYISPPLTSVWQPSYQKGEKSMRMLIDCLEKGEMPSAREEFNCITVYRNSCAPPEETAPEKSSE